MAELTYTEAPKEPATKFGKSLVSFALTVENFANIETNKTHGDMCKALGTEAIVGAVAIASLGSGHEIDSLHVVESIMEKTKHVGRVFSEQPNIDAFKTDGQREIDKYFNYMGRYDVKLDDFARSLIQGDFKDSSGKPVYLLDQKETGEVAKLLDQLNSLENIRDKWTEFMALTAVGSAMILTTAKEKANEKLKYSTTVLPLASKAIKAIGNLF